MAMKISSKVFAASTFFLSLIFINSSTTIAAHLKETFLNPQIEGKYIDACLNSFRFQDGCNKPAQNEVANQFCRWRRYSSAIQWQSQDFGWKNRTINWKWTERYTDGELQANFFSNEGANRFTVIECR